MAADLVDFMMYTWVTCAFSSLVGVLWFTPGSSKVPGFFLATATYMALGPFGLFILAATINESLSYQRKIKAIIASTEDIKKYMADLDKQEPKDPVS